MQEDIKPAFSVKNIPIVFSADNNYTPMMGVAIYSLIKNVSDEYNYDILIFNKDISQENKEKILGMIDGEKNISIRFIDFSEIVKDLKLPTFKNYTIEIYFRLFMPYILEKYDKALYLDSDLVLTGDVAKLWNEDLKGKTLGAVIDIGMVLHYYTKGKKYIKKEYFENTLKKVNPDKYFNSGVLIIDLKQMKEKYDLENDILKIIEQEELHYPDQDALNILFCDDTQYISFRYNCVPENCGNRNIENICKDVPEELANAYVESRKDPIIVHYALIEKPWIYSCKLDYELYKYFWIYAAESPYAYDVISIKKKKANFAEVKYIIDTFYSEKMNKVLKKKDIKYVWKNKVIARESKLPFYYECCEITKDGIMIEGYSNILKEENPEDVQFYFRLNGDAFYKCDVFERRVNRYQKCIEKVKDPTFGKAVGFKCLIPFNKDEKIYKITCYRKYEDKYIKKKYIKSGRYFPIDKKNRNQYFYKNGYIMTFNKNKTLILKRANILTKIVKEVKFLRAIWKRNLKHDRTAAMVRILLFIRDIFKRKPIWLIYDNYITDDNGIAFYNYLKNNKRKKCKPYFIIQKNSPKYEELRKDRHVVVANTQRFRWLSLVSEVLVGSVINASYRFPFQKITDDYRDRLMRRKFVFLQHGIITDDLTKEHNKYVYFPSGFITSAKAEYNSLLEYPYHYTEKEVWLTGLARYDLLYNNPKKYITIMPTWRKYLNDPNTENKVVSDFEKSKFFKFYSSLLNNKELLENAEKYGYKICFKPHPLLKKAAHLFIQPENEEKIKILDDYNYRNVFAESSLIVSDYSSAVLDFVYLRKPIIYAHFDRKEFFENHVYDQGYFDYDKDGFGKVEVNLDETVKDIIKYMKKDCKLEKKYINNIDNFFAYDDKENCKRIYEKIVELD